MAFLSILWYQEQESCGSIVITLPYEATQNSLIGMASFFPTQAAPASAKIFTTNEENLPLTLLSLLVFGTEELEHYLNLSHQIMHFHFYSYYLSQFLLSSRSDLHLPQDQLFCLTDLPHL